MLSSKMTTSEFNEQVGAYFAIASILAFLPALSIGVLQAYLHGVSARDLALIVGAIASAPLLFLQAGYRLQLMTLENRPGSSTALVRTLALTSTLIPFVFVLYLLTYIGLWGLVTLFSSFSWISFIVGLYFSISGYISLIHLANLNRLLVAIQKRKIRAISE